MRVEGRLLDDVRLNIEKFQIINYFSFSRVQINMIKEKLNGNFLRFFEVLL
jgi:hypothetical protein